MGKKRWLTTLKLEGCFPLGMLRPITGALSRVIFRFISAAEAFSERRSLGEGDGGGGSFPTSDNLTLKKIDCFPCAFSQQNFLDTIWSGGIMRTFRVYVPAIYDGQTPRPLVFQFHGVSSTAVQFENYTKFKSVADTANFILITPNGTVGTLLPSGYGQTWNNFDFDSVDDVLSPAPAAHYYRNSGIKPAS